jgi:hypothetical protein
LFFKQHASGFIEIFKDVFKSKMKWTNKVVETFAYGAYNPRKLPKRSEIMLKYSMYLN